MDDNSTVTPTEKTQSESSAQNDASQIPDAPLTPAISEKQKKSFFGGKKSLVLLFVGLLVLGGTAAGYVTFFKAKSPEQVWASALENTAQGLEELTSMPATDSKGMKVEGKLNLSAPVVVTGTMSGTFYETNGQMTMGVEVLDKKLEAEMRVTGSQEEKNEKVYLKASGLELLPAILGGDEETNALIASLEDKWIVLDMSSLSGLAGITGQPVPSADAASELSNDDIAEITKKVTETMNTYIFSTDDNAVLTIQEKIGSEEFEGVPTYKMKMGVDKDNFKEFLIALKDALKETKVKDLLLNGETTKTFEDALAFNEMLQAIDAADFSKMYAHVWVQEDGAFVRNIRIYPVEGKENSNYLDLGMNPDGGDTIPVSIRVTFDEDNSKGTYGLILTMSKTQPTLGAVISMNIESPMAITGDVSITLTGSDEQVTIEEPKGATDILNSLLGNMSELYQLNTNNSNLLNSLPAGADYSGLDDTELQ